MTAHENTTRNDAARPGAGIAGSARIGDESGVMRRPGTRRNGNTGRTVASLRVHRAPIPGEDEPLPGETPAPDPHPVPDDDPVPDRDPVVGRSRQAGPADAIDRVGR